MASVKSYTRAALFFACIALSILALVNVFADNADVIEQARKIACDTSTKAPCGLTHGDRTPFAQTFEFATKAAPIVVRCSRAAIFVGEYTCERR